MASTASLSSSVLGSSNPISQTQTKRADRESTLSWSPIGGFSISSEKTFSERRTMDAAQVVLSEQNNRSFEPQAKRQKGWTMTICPEQKTAASSESLRTAPDDLTAFCQIEELLTQAELFPIWSDTHEEETLFLVNVRFHDHVGNLATNPRLRDSVFQRFTTLKPYILNFLAVNLLSCDQDLAVRFYREAIDCATSQQARFARNEALDRLLSEFEMTNR